MQKYFNARALVPMLVLAVSACATTTTPSPQEGAVVTTTAQPAAVATVTLPTELTTIHPAFVTAWQGTDPAALEVYFTPTTTVVTPNGTFTGWTDINGKWISPLLPTIHNYTLTPMTFTRNGDVIVESGNFGYMLNNNGTMSNVSGTFTYNWAKQPDGTWRITSVTIK